jgi:hypothetical protein
MTSTNKTIYINILNKGLTSAKSVGYFDVNEYLGVSFGHRGDAGGSERIYKAFVSSPL